ncbi:hypothetical protein ABZZ80_12620 [Streptomyces sp. NPDC006356]
MRRCRDRPPLPGALLYCDRACSASRRSPSHVLSWTNDILPGPRELLRPGALNLIAALAEGRDCSYHPALDRAADMHAQETRIFLDLADEERTRGCDPRLDHHRPFSP